MFQARTGFTHASRLNRYGEPYEVFALVDGEFRSLGEVTGTAEFDLSSLGGSPAPVSVLRIVDKAKVTSGSNNGSSLDAIVALNFGAPVENSYSPAKSAFQPISPTPTLASTAGYRASSAPSQIDSPASALDLRFGETIFGQLMDEQDIFAIDVVAGDMLVIRANLKFVESSVHRPDGSLLCEVPGREQLHPSWPDQSEAVCKVDMTGRHFVLIHPYLQAIVREGGREYRLTVERINRPSNAGQIKYGQTKTREFAADVTIDVQHFLAANGDRVLLRTGLPVQQLKL